MKPPSFPLYVNNWLASQRISEMCPAQEGAYLRLLCYQWNSKDQTLPEDDSKLAILSRLNLDWGTLGGPIKECFHIVPEQPGRIRNERLFACWNEAIAYREKQSQAGKIGMAKRWKGHSKTTIKQSNNVVITALYPKHNSESESESESYTDSEFDTFWNAYPNKTGKKAAKKAWDKATDKPSIEKLLSALENQKQSVQWKKDGGQFIPNPATWLNQGRWDDAATQADSTQQDIFKGCI